MIVVEYKCKDVSVWEVIQWCQENCTDNYEFSRDWAKQIATGKDCHVMKFESEKDASLFTLRWL